MSTPQNPQPGGEPGESTLPISPAVLRIIASRYTTITPVAQLASVCRSSYRVLQAPVWKHDLNRRGIPSLYEAIRQRDAPMVARLMTSYRALGATGFLDGTSVAWDIFPRSGRRAWNLSTYVPPIILATETGDADTLRAVIAHSTRREMFATRIVPTSDNPYILPDVRRTRIPHCTCLKGGTAEVTLFSECRETALFTAVGKLDAELIRILIGAGMRVDRLRAKSPPVFQGHCVATPRLLGRLLFGIGALVDERQRALGNPANCYASLGSAGVQLTVDVAEAKARLAQTLDLLLEFGFDPGYVGGLSRETCLLYWAVFGRRHYWPAAQALIGLGADFGMPWGGPPEIPRSPSSTPLPMTPYEYLLTPPKGFMQMQHYASIMGERFVVAVSTLDSEIRWEAQFWFEFLIKQTYEEVRNQSDPVSRKKCKLLLDLWQHAIRTFQPDCNALSMAIWNIEYREMTGRPFKNPTPLA
ncbi:hypothetical protein QBC47DRAFT_362592 [Echria macrotheca]|uniref:Uncharacterized protein n=1 Tax=Echria macrotheca TaxID=438768 RepID=A0AAJ0B8P1_9PEZI|nr:hypothetical protein QBC47DRAFT_362592 [Echria macrotheca]